MKVSIMSQDNAMKYAKNTDNKILIISIVSKKDRPINFEGDNIVNIFRMFFNDLEYSVGVHNPPIREDFIGLKDFLDNNIDSNIDEIVVHCHAGVSRSSGCASAITRYLGMDDRHIWSSELYIPNKRVYKCALEELNIEINQDELIELYELNYEAQMLTY